MTIQESGQDYLETILMIRNKKGIVRSVDVAESLSFSKPSVSVAMKTLKNGGYIEMDEEKCIYLTEKGEALAQQMYERHVFLSDWLEKLGVSRETALKDACKIEHDLSVESYTAIKKHVAEYLAAEDK